MKKSELNRVWIRVEIEQTFRQVYASWSFKVELKMALFNFMKCLI